MRGNTSAQPQLSEQDPRDQELQLLRQLLQEKDEQLDAAGGFCNVRVEQRAFASVRYAL
jgi:hypothetical protein